MTMIITRANKRGKTIRENNSFSKLRSVIFALIDYNSYYSRYYYYYCDIDIYLNFDYLLINNYTDNRKVW